MFATIKPGETIAIKRRKPWARVAWVQKGPASAAADPCRLFLTDGIRLADLHRSGKAPRSNPALDRVLPGPYSAVAVSARGTHVAGASLHGDLFLWNRLTDVSALVPAPETAIVPAGPGRRSSKRPVELDPDATVSGPARFLAVSDPGDRVIVVYARYAAVWVASSATWYRLAVPAPFLEAPLHGQPMQACFATSVERGDSCVLSLCLHAARRRVAVHIVTLAWDRPAASARSAFRTSATDQPRPQPFCASTQTLVFEVSSVDDPVASSAPPSSVLSPSSSPRYVRMGSGGVFWTKTLKSSSMPNVLAAPAPDSGSSDERPHLLSLWDPLGDTLVLVAHARHPAAHRLIFVARGRSVAKSVGIGDIFAHSVRLTRGTDPDWRVTSLAWSPDAVLVFLSTSLGHLAVVTRHGEPVWLAPPTGPPPPPTRLLTILRYMEIVGPHDAGGEDHDDADHDDTGGAAGAAAAAVYSQKFSLACHPVLPLIAFSDGYTVVVLHLPALLAARCVAHAQLAEPSKRAAQLAGLDKTTAHVHRIALAWRMAVSHPDPSLAAHAQTLLRTLIVKRPALLDLGLQSKLLSHYRWTGARAGYRALANRLSIATFERICRTGDLKHALHALRIAEELAWTELSCWFAGADQQPQQLVFVAQWKLLARHLLWHHMTSSSDPRGSRRHSPASKKASVSRYLPYLDALISILDHPATWPRTLLDSDPAPAHPALDAATAAADGDTPDLRAAHLQYLQGNFPESERLYRAAGGTSGRPAVVALLLLQYRVGDALEYVQEYRTDQGVLCAWSFVMAAYFLQLEIAIFTPSQTSLVEALALALRHLCQGDADWADRGNLPRVSVLSRPRLQAALRRDLPDWSIDSVILYFPTESLGPFVPLLLTKLGLWREAALFCASSLPSGLSAAYDVLRRRLSAVLREPALELEPILQVFAAARDARVDSHPLRKQALQQILQELKATLRSMPFVVRSSVDLEQPYRFVVAEPDALPHEDPAVPVGARDEAWYRMRITRLLSYFVTLIAGNLAEFEPLFRAGRVVGQGHLFNLFRLFCRYLWYLHARDQLAFAVRKRDALLQGLRKRLVYSMVIRQGQRVEPASAALQERSSAAVKWCARCLPFYDLEHLHLIQDILLTLLADLDCGPQAEVLATLPEHDVVKSLLQKYRRAVSRIETDAPATYASLHAKFAEMEGQEPSSQTLEMAWVFEGDAEYVSLIHDTVFQPCRALGVHAVLRPLTPSPPLSPMLAPGTAGSPAALSPSQQSSVRSRMRLRVESVYEGRSTIDMLVTPMLPRGASRPSDAPDSPWLSSTPARRPFPGASTPLREAEAEAGAGGEDAGGEEPAAKELGAAAEHEEAQILEQTRETEKEEEDQEQDPIEIDEELEEISVGTLEQSSELTSFVTVEDDEILAASRSIDDEDYYDPAPDVAEDLVDELVLEVIEDQFLDRALALASEKVVNLVLRDSMSKAATAPPTAARQPPPPASSEDLRQETRELLSGAWDLLRRLESQVSGTPLPRARQSQQTPDGLGDAPPAARPLMHGAFLHASPADPARTRTPGTRGMAVPLADSVPLLHQVTTAARVSASPLAPPPLLQTGPSPEQQQQQQQQQTPAKPRPLLVIDQREPPPPEPEPRPLPLLARPDRAPVAHMAAQPLPLLNVGTHPRQEPEVVPDPTPTPSPPPPDEPRPDLRDEQLELQRQRIRDLEEARKADLERERQLARERDEARAAELERERQLAQERQEARDASIELERKLAREREEQQLRELERLREIDRLRKETETALKAPAPAPVHTPSKEVAVATEPAAEPKAAAAAAGPTTTDAGTMAQRPETVDELVSPMTSIDVESVGVATSVQPEASGETSGEVSYEHDSFESDVLSLDDEERVPPRPLHRDEVVAPDFAPSLPPDVMMAVSASAASRPVTQSYLQVVPLEKRRPRPRNSSKFAQRSPKVTSIEELRGAARQPMTPPSARSSVVSGELDLQVRMGTPPPHQSSPSVVGLQHRRKVREMERRLNSMTSLLAEVEMAAERVEAEFDRSHQIVQDIELEQQRIMSPRTDASSAGLDMSGDSGLADADDVAAASEFPVHHASPGPLGTQDPLEKRLAAAAALMRELH